MLLSGLGNLEMCLVCIQSGFLIILGFDASHEYVCTNNISGHITGAVTVKVSTL